MTTTAKIKADILDRIPADQRAEYLTLKRDIAAKERESKKIQREVEVLRKRLTRITSAAAEAATTDRDIAILRHSGTTASSRFYEAIRAIHPRFQGTTNYTIDDAPKGTAPFLGAEINLYPFSGNLTADLAPEIADALVAFADRFVGDDIADFGDHAGRIYTRLMTQSDGRSRGMIVFYAPTGAEASLFIVDYDGDQPVVNGTLNEVLTVAIERAMAWAAEDSTADDPDWDDENDD